MTSPSPIAPCAPFHIRNPQYIFSTHIHHPSRMQYKKTKTRHHPLTIPASAHPVELLYKPMVRRHSYDYRPRL